MKKKKLSRLQKKIIITAVLLVLAAFLFILKLFITPTPENEIPKSVQKDFTYRKSDFKDEITEIRFIEGRIDSVLFGFGIKKDWILAPANQSAKEKTKKQNSNTIRHEGNKIVSLPKDLPIPEILADINFNLQIEDISLTATEDYESGNTILTISGLKSPYILNLYYDDKLRRDDDRICLVLNKLSDYKQEDAFIVLNALYSYSVVMPLTLDRIDLQAAIIDSKRDYIIYPEIGRAEDYESDIRKDKDWISKVYSLCTDYDKNKAIVLSNPHNAIDFEKDFIAELSKCRGYIYRDTIFSKVAETKSKDKKISAVLNELILSSKNRSSNTRVYLIKVPPEEFDEFIKTVASLEKAGIRFVTFSQFMKKQNG